MDPYTAVRDEVEHSVTVVTQLHAKWNELKGATRKSDEFEWTSSELLSGLRSIEWDLQDLEDTISIVESSPQKFQISEDEVNARRDFIEATRQRINAMRDEVQGQAQAEAPTGYSTKKGGGLPSVTKAKGYGKVGASEDAVEVSVQPMPSAVDDEILGVDLQSSSAEGSGRHKRKKLCITATVILLILAFAFKGMGAPTASAAPLEGANAEQPGSMPELAVVTNAAAPLVSPATLSPTGETAAVTASDNTPNEDSTVAASSNSTRLLAESSGVRVGGGV